MQFTPMFKIGIWNAWIFSVFFLLIPYSLFLINRAAYKKMGNSPDSEPGKSIKIIGYTASAIYYIVFLYTIFLPLKLGTAWFYTGLIIFLLALLMTIMAGLNFITTPPGRPVTKGLYRYSRHPMYLSQYLALVGIGIAAASWIILLVSIVFMILVKIYTDYEEQYCKERYGDSYKKYLAATPKWIGIPRL
jgi:protein-S-isoprenylcysteine O-methyltransferase Ste14